MDKEKSLANRIIDDYAKITGIGKDKSIAELTYSKTFIEDIMNGKADNLSEEDAVKTVIKEMHETNEKLFWEHKDIKENDIEDYFKNRKQADPSVENQTAVNVADIKMEKKEKKTIHHKFLKTGVLGVVLVFIFLSMVGYISAFYPVSGNKYSSKEPASNSGMHGMMKSSLGAITDTAQANSLATMSVQKKSAESVNTDDFITGAKSQELSESQIAENSTDERKIIYTAYIGIETQNFDGFVSSIKNKAKEFGGYVESSDVNGKTPDRYGNLVFRIPTENLDAFLSYSKESGNCTSESSSVSDITLEYHDTEARKEALQKEYDKITELITKSDSIDDVIALESRLSDIQYQLDNYSTDLRKYDDKVKYSTVTISVTETEKLTPVSSDSYGERLATGFRNNMIAVKEFFMNIFSGIITHIPSIITAIIILAVVRWLSLRCLKSYLKWIEKKKEKKNIS